MGRPYPGADQRKYGEPVKTAACTEPRPEAGTKDAADR
jgi:hypothetical protein